MGLEENKVEKHLDKQVRLLNGFTCKWTGTVGCPDRIVFLPDGRVYFVELKTLWGTLQYVQKRFIDKLSKVNNNVRVLHGKVQVDEFINEIKNENKVN